MSPVHLHILLAHIPVIIIPLAAVILLVALVRSIEVFKTLSLILIIFSSAVTVPVYFLGEEAEETIEHSEEFRESDIEEHEEAGEFAYLTVCILGVLSFLLLISSRFLPSFYNNKTLTLILVAALFASTVLAMSANKGGKISHPEAFQNKL